jgi:hypothetical protein
MQSIYICPQYLEAIFQPLPGDLLYYVKGPTELEEVVVKTCGIPLKLIPWVVKRQQVLITSSFQKLRNWQRKVTANDLEGNVFLFCYIYSSIDPKAAMWYKDI